MIQLVLILVLCIGFSVAFNKLPKPVSFWVLKNQTGIADGQSLRLRKLNHPTNHLHTCYEITCEGKECTGRRGKDPTVIQVCYPALVVSGLPKCGTSAMYGLLSKFPGRVLLRDKENCPFTKYPMLWKYFESLPRLSTIGAHNITIDGCIHPDLNIRIREVLRDPKTLYIVMIRDYTDMLWSAYNFFCHPGYEDKNCSTITGWANATLHIRSPDLFHHIFEPEKGNLTSATPPDNPLSQSCVNGKNYYTSVFNQLQGKRPRYRTVLVANEELDLYPLRVAHRIATAVNHSIEGIDLSAFNKVRINAQENKGTNSVINKDNFLPGLYNISHYQSPLPKSRLLLNKCWHEDCIALSKIPPYYKYTACFPERNTTVGNVTTTNADRNHYNNNATHEEMRLLDLY